MSLYCIGDIQGCDGALERLLGAIDFSPSRDTVYLLGDLVNRGPQSARTLRRCMRHEGSIRVLLGNHDLHLLAAAGGRRKSSRRDTLRDVLDAADADAMLAWLRRQPLAQSHTLAGETLLMVHAGVHPHWSEADTLRLAREVEQVLQGEALPGFLEAMYGNEPDRWREDLAGLPRLRVITNVLTRMRFCTADGRMDFDSAEGADAAPPGLMPWFEVPGRRARHTAIAFGHWSTLGLLNRPRLLGLDTGCVWGGCLSAVRFGASLQEREVIEVRCEQAQAPGR